MTSSRPYRNLTALASLLRARVAHPRPTRSGAGPLPSYLEGKLDASARRVFECLLRIGAETVVPARGRRDQDSHRSNGAL